MLINDLIWTEDNIDHIADHHVTPEEVEEVIWDNPWFERRRGRERYYAFGQTNAGRYLFIVLDREEGSLYYVVTARDMTSSERQYYQRRRKR